MPQTHDVVITGCGPAGSMAGLVLARSGCRVLLLDRARFPRPKLCGGLLTWKTTRLLDRVAGLSPDDLMGAGAISHVSDRYEIHGPKGLLASGGLSAPFHFSDRTALDALLLDRARGAGAEVREGVRVTGCDPGKGELVTEDGTIKGRWVLGADGANSVVRGSFPPTLYDRARWKRYLAPAIEVHIPKAHFPRPVEAPELYVGRPAAGYGWVFPGRDHVLAGMCGLREPGNFGTMVRDYLLGLGVSPEHVPELRGHPLPYGNYLDRPVCGRVLLAGDAGGFVEPLFGEGIFFALATGLYAGQALVRAVRNGEDPGPAYMARLKRSIMPELKGSDRLRWALFRSVALLGTAPLGLFVRMGAHRLGDMVHGKRSYHLLRTKCWDFLEDYED